jgi:hypothetical protein
LKLNFGVFTIFYFVHFGKKIFIKKIFLLNKAIIQYFLNRISEECKNLFIKIQLENFTFIETCLINKLVTLVKNLEKDVINSTNGQIVLQNVCVKNLFYYCYYKILRKLFFGGYLGQWTFGCGAHKIATYVPIFIKFYRNMLNSVDYNLSKNLRIFGHKFEKSCEKNFFKFSL